MTEPFILGTVLVGYDRTTRGRDALRLAELLARTAGARLLVVSVSEPDSEREPEAEVSRLLAASRVPLESRSVAGPSPARVLHDLASADNRVGLIVLGSTHRVMIGGASPGSVAAKLLSGAPCAVAVAPRGYAGGDGRLALAEEIRVIAVAFDDSPEARAALKLAAAIGLRCRATLQVIAADHRATTAVAGAAAAAAAPVPSRAYDLQDRLHAVVGELPRELRALPVFDRKDPVSLLVDRVGVGVDLLVMGSRGYGPLRSVLLGGVSGAVVDRAACPVLIVPRAASSS